MSTVIETPSIARTVGYHDLREYVQLLESSGLVHHVKAQVDPHHEMGAIVARSLARKGPAIIFDNVKGYAGKPFLANIMSTTQQLGVIFGVEPDEELIQQRVVEGMNKRIPSVTLATGPCKEVVLKGDEANVDFFPTPLWHEQDGGRFLGTTAGIVTREPSTGQINLGMYRSMIKDGRTLTITGKFREPGTTAGSGGPDHWLENWEKGVPTPIAIVMGMEPLLTLAAGSPVAPGNDGSMEYEAAAGWRGAPTELVKCETNDLLVPARAEMIIEGFVVPGVRTEEGPHGESTGFYSGDKTAFQIDITCITHRRDPISYGLICLRVEDYPRQLLRSGSMQARIIEKTGFTNIREVYFPEVGRMGALIVSAKIRDKDDPRRLMDAIWNDSGEAWRWVIVVDEDCNVRDWDDVMWRVVSTADPEKHVVLGTFHPTPTRRKEFVPPNRGIGIDATFGFKEPFPPVNVISRDLNDKVAARWKELGLP